MKRPKTAKPWSTESNRPPPVPHSETYGWQHQQRARRMLADHVWCQVCNVNFASELHHDRYGPDITDADCRVVCRRCHVRLTRGERI